MIFVPVIGRCITLARVMYYKAPGHSFQTAPIVCVRLFRKGKPIPGPNWSSRLRLHRNQSSLMKEWSALCWMNINPISRQIHLKTRRNPDKNSCWRHTERADFERLSALLYLRWLGTLYSQWDTEFSFFASRDTSSRRSLCSSHGIYSLLDSCFISVFQGSHPHSCHRPVIF